MSSLSIFLSSTCYDLKAVREHLDEGITALGHEVIRSELPNFPVDPTSQTITACRSVVRDKADILVLIIGGRYGYTDPSTNRSVTNLEYIEAKKKNIDRYVFVESKVWDLLTIYKDNPAGNFASAVESTRIFDFINEVKKEGSWVYKFNQTSDIITVLRHQLSIRHKKLLTLFRESRITPAREFKNESEAIQDLILTKPNMWEHKLTHLLLQDRLADVKTRYEDAKKGTIIRRSKHLSASDSFRFMQEMQNDIMHLVDAMKSAITEEIDTGWGPPGINGNEFLIKKGCDTLHRVGLGLIDWELDLKFNIPCDEFSEIITLMQGWSEDILQQLDNACDQIGKLAMIDPETTSGTYDIKITLNSPRNIEEICKRIQALGNSAGLISRLRNNWQ